MNNKIILSLVVICFIVGMFAVMSVDAQYGRGMSHTINRLLISNDRGSNSSNKY